MNKSLIAVIATLGCGLFSATALAASDEHAPASLTRQLLLKKKLTLPANTIESKVIRVLFPRGYKTPVHTHEGPGPRYVLKGKLKVEDSGESHVFGAGEVFWETGEAMTVENIGAGEAEIVIFEMAPAK